MAFQVSWTAESELAHGAWHTRLVGGVAGVDGAGVAESGAGNQDWCRGGGDGMVAWCGCGRGGVGVGAVGWGGVGWDNVGRPVVDIVGRSRMSEVTSHVIIQELVGWERSSAILMEAKKLRLDWRLCGALRSVANGSLIISVVLKKNLRVLSPCRIMHEICML